MKNFPLLAMILTILAAPASLSNAFNCKACHAKENPTKTDAALIQCPRNLVKGYHSSEEAPPTLQMAPHNEDYGPVMFSHKAHAEMSEMGGGCTLCHHYNQARPIQPCSDCHSASRLREDLDKPDVKAAVHRLCMDCHRQWAPETGCGSCHAKAGAKRTPLPKTSLPKHKLYTTESPIGRFVTFPHEAHHKLYGFACTHCHQQQSCDSCHTVKTPPQEPSAADGTKKDLSLKETHQRCFTCHANADCASCHKEKK